jgi:hypothetical protein
MTAAAAAASAAIEVIAGREDDRRAFAIIVFSLDKLCRGHKFLLFYDLVIEASRAKAVGTILARQNRR